MILFRIITALAAFMVVTVTATLQAAPYMPSQGTISYVSGAGGPRFYYDVSVKLTVHRSPQNPQPVYFLDFMVNNILPYHYLSWSADYTHVLFMDRPVETNTLALRLAQTSTAVLPYDFTLITLDSLPAPTHYALSPDATQVAYLRNDAIWRYNIETGTDEEIYPPGQYELLRWSPDGNTLLFNTGRDAVLLHMHTQTVQPLNDHDILKSSMAFSPDSRSVAYADLDSGIYLSDTATGTYRAVVEHTGPGIFAHLAWSPDGQYIVYNVQGNDDRLEIVEVATGRKQRIPYSGRVTNTLDWTP